ncbi:hypothetical protein JL722_3647 [Aureococcus anophagefferens]|nr:hypothetical protein JL722_3647 [Aureococcus anophagefferens]
MKSIGSHKDEIKKLKAQSKEHRRSQLIQELRGKLREQELAVDVLKEALVEGPRGALSADQVNELVICRTLGGPKRFRPKTREELQNELAAATRRNDALAKRAERSEARAKEAWAARPAARRARRRARPPTAAATTLAARRPLLRDGSGPEELPSAAHLREVGELTNRLEEAEKLEAKYDARERDVVRSGRPCASTTAAADESRSAKGAPTRSAARADAKDLKTAQDEARVATAKAEILQGHVDALHHELASADALRRSRGRGEQARAHGEGPRGREHRATEALLLATQRGGDDGVLDAGSTASAASALTPVQTDDERATRAALAAHMKLADAYANASAVKAAPRVARNLEEAHRRALDVARRELERAPPPPPRYSRLHHHHGTHVSRTPGAELAAPTPAVDGPALEVKIRGLDDDRLREPDTPLDDRYLGDDDGLEFSEYSQGSASSRPSRRPEPSPAASSASLGSSRSRRSHDGSLSSRTYSVGNAATRPSTSRPTTSTLVLRRRAETKFTSDHFEELHVSHYAAEPARNASFYVEHVDGPWRAATLIMYLSDVVAGGETVFPKIARPGASAARAAALAHQHGGPTVSELARVCDDDAVLKIRPAKGAALLFYSLTPDGREEDNARTPPAPCFVPICDAAAAEASELEAYARVGDGRRRARGGAGAEGEWLRGFGPIDVAHDRDRPPASTGRARPRA